MNEYQSSIPSAVTATKMAEMCGLSRSRFYSLIGKGVFPPPVPNGVNNRPIYDQKLIRKCLEIRCTGVSLDGSLVTFNAKRTGRMKPTAKQPTTKASSHADLVAGLKSLGLTGVTESQTTTVVEELFPDGVDGIAPGEVIRRVFLAIKQRE
ncbi:helix-turn-helix transcriptional regulator [Bremerella sp. P1]|uniref:helix-turn-helix transcriptional regulator n=1 Tax=Bremerella sp. P1 TaxID=3026424 RepID=UPI00236762AB|nr:AlpA family phage regulatory protein [Bremerella sp. P1]WDI43713.1 AlpA family phage regulatory protein [Bremerella sp. P1]